MIMIIIFKEGAQLALALFSGTGFKKLIDFYDLHANEKIGSYWTKPEWRFEKIKLKMYLILVLLLHLNED